MWRRKRALKGLDDDIRDHIARETEEHVARGMAPDEARRQALLKFGNVALAKEDTRAVWAWVWLEQLVHDTRYAIRMLARNPGFAAVAILTLAIGIGANVVIFSVVDAALFRPLPYRDADRLVDLFVTTQNPRGDRVQVVAEGRRIEEVRQITSVFDGVDAYTTPRPKTLAAGSDVRLQIGAFTPTLLEFLGVTPQLGRGFSQEDVVAGDAIVISDVYWQRAFNRERNVLGTTMAFADRTCVVVGIMPSTFRYFVGADADAWVPLVARDGGRLVARLRPGLSVTQAQQDLNVAVAAPSMTWKPRGVEIVPAGWMRAGGAYSSRGRATRAMLFGLLGAVGFLLAIACANVANLLLSRTLTRQREIAVRGSLGATRLRLVRQFLTEGLVLTGTGSLAAVALAWWGIRAVPSIMPAELVFSVFGASYAGLDWRALTFACLIAIITGSFCGAATAIWASRPTVTAGSLAGGRRVLGASRGERRMRDAFQALQVAMTVVLLSGAGLLVASFLRMVAMPAGFDPQNLAYADLTFPRGGSFNRTGFFDELIARTGTIPGVLGVTVGSPVSGYSDAKFLMEDGNPAAAAPLEFFVVRPDYFRIAGIPLKEGRIFGPEDHENAPLVAIVSETVAQRFWPGQSPLGRRFRRYYPDDPPITIVGVVPSAKTLQLPRNGVEAYLPTAQTFEASELLFRFTGDPAPITAAIRLQARAIDPNVGVTRVGLVENLFAEFDPLGPTRFYALLLGLFAILGLLTAAVGLYGVLSYAVGRRTHEIGVRLALGAGRARVRWLVLTEVLTPVAAGTVVGLVATTWLSRFIESRLFQVAPNDPWVLGTIVAVLLGVCAIAVLVPVRRATHIEPAEALRAD